VVQGLLYPKYNPLSTYIPNDGPNPIEKPSPSQCTKSVFVSFQ
jgi:hypothetical protein